VPVGYNQPCRISDNARTDKINDDRSIESIATSIILGGIDHPFSSDADDGGHDGFNYVGQ
jgi:hypothetical protein